MSLTGGYDIAIEISKEAFRRLILKNGTIGKTPIVPEFELPPLPGSQGNPHVIIRDISLDLQPFSNLMTLRLDFHRSTISVSGRVIDRLAGTITLSNIPLELDTVRDGATRFLSSKALFIRLSRATDTASFTFTDASLQRIRRAISGLITESIFIDQVTANLRTYLTTNVGADPKFPKDPNDGFFILPGNDGILDAQPLGEGVIFEQLDKVFVALKV